MNELLTGLEAFADWQVEAFLDGESLAGEGMAALAAFLQQHPTIHADLRRQQRQMRRVKSRLYRYDCPSAEAMQHYYARDLSKAEQARFEQHIEICPHCNRELAQLQQFMVTEVAAAPQSSALSQLMQQAQNFVERLQVVVATLLPPLTPQAAGVVLRQDAGLPVMQAARSPVSLLFTAEETDISLLIETEEEGSGRVGGGSASGGSASGKADRFRMTGQLFALASTVGSTATLVSADPLTLPQQTHLNETETFVFHSLAAGEYQLTVRLSNKAIVIPGVVV